MEVKGPSILGTNGNLECRLIRISRLERELAAIGNSPQDFRRPSQRVWTEDYRGVVSQSEARCLSPAKKDELLLGPRTGRR